MASGSNQVSTTPKARSTKSTKTPRLPSTTSMPERVVTIDEVESADFECEPFKSFKLECNTCWCAKNGKGPRDCTRIACDPKTYPSLN